MKLPFEPVTVSALPPVVDRADWSAALDELLVREKAHTREGDAIAAARRRLPMTLVPADATVDGPDGQIPFVDVFEGRRMLVGYFHMWHDGRPFSGQCMGCTFSTAQIQFPEYLNARDVTLAVLAEGSYAESKPYADFMGYRVPWYSARGSDSLVAGRGFGFFAFYLRDDDDRVYETYWTTDRGTEVADWSYGLLDMTVFGRQENWEDSPEGWPKGAVGAGTAWVTNGRPTAQWAVTDEPAEAGAAAGH
jgi:predicted dithiol-disulfide oxidoreductase (DUF899 family)